jgi:hypothetical protein
VNLFAPDNALARSSPRLGLIHQDTVVNMDKPVELINRVDVALPAVWRQLASKPTLPVLSEEINVNQRSSDYTVCTKELQPAGTQCSGPILHSEPVTDAPLPTNVEINVVSNKNSSPGCVLFTFFTD